MGESVIQVSPNSTGAKVRTRQRVVGSNTVEEQYVIPTTDRVVSARVSVSTFRIAGLASTPHNLFTLENTSGSSVLVAIRRLTIQEIGTAASAVLTTFRTFKGTTVPTGGTTLTKTTWDSLDSSAANVVARGAASADGTASAITYALPAGTPLWTQFISTMVTSGVYLGVDQSLLPVLAEENPVILRAAQSILVAAVTASLTTKHYVVNCMWEEFTLP